MLPLTIVIPLAAACGYAVFGWHRLTVWWGAGAAGLTVAVSLWQPAEFMVVVIAVSATAALSATPALIANDLADNRTGARMARVFGVGSCLIVAASQLAVVAAAWWLRAAALLCAVGCCWLLIVARRRPVTWVASRHMAFVAGAAAVAIGIGLLTGIETPVGATAAVAGFATLAGVAPWATWLGHVHRAATTPVAILVSAVVLPAAWYQLWRLLDVFDTSLWLVVAGVGLLTATTVAIRANDIRVLPVAATIAHFGMAVAAATTTSDMRPVAALVLASGLSCAAASTVTGHIVALTGSGRAWQARGLWGRHRLLAGLATAAMSAVLTTPVILTAVNPVPGWWWSGATVVYLACASVLAMRTAGVLRGEAGGHVAIGVARPLASAAIVLPGILGFWALTVISGVT